ncbi:MAG: hypothetical protein JWM56_1096 [Candidatus Peribacteria bacterium]|nr:hypothetical protein [Candidatus Peribacteria bacterium]
MRMGIFVTVLVACAAFFMLTVQAPLPSSPRVTRPDAAQFSVSSIAATPSSAGFSASYSRVVTGSGCTLGILPDPACTPGDVFAGVTEKDICTSGYAKKVRDVSAALKKQVYEEYSVQTHAAGEYEVDHFISLELGGSNSIRNLWPEPAEPRPGFHEKDVVENYLHNQVCRGILSLSQAQEQIRSNWYQVYQNAYEGR